MWEKLHYCPGFTVRHCSGFRPSHPPRHTVTARGAWVAEHDVEEEAWPCWFMAKEKTNQNRTGLRFIGVTDEDQEAQQKRSCEKREDEIVFLFYKLKKIDLREKRRERRWGISGSYRLCFSYILVSNEWNRVWKVKKKSVLRAKTVFLCYKKLKTAFGCK